MAYTKTQWKNNDIITAEKLNKMEDGITNVANAINIVECIQDTDNNIATIQKAAGELEYLFYDSIVFVKIIQDNQTIAWSHIYSFYNDGTYRFTVKDYDDYVSYTASSATDYPTCNLQPIQ